MIKHLLTTVVLLLLAFGLFRWAVSESDVVRTRPRRNGGYFIMYSGKRVWVNRSFREGSMSGNFRGRGPRGGK